MCGICCYIGYKPGCEHVFNGMYILLNRGYDAVGFCTMNTMNKSNKLFVKKRSITKSDNSANKNAIDYMKAFRDDFKDSTTILGHSRWKTVGTNHEDLIQFDSHPHVDHTERFALVHNGTIENYDELKTELISKHGIKFKSETDTEVIVQLISVLYDEYKCVEKAINEALSRLEGTWGLVITTTEQPDKMYCARHGSPLLIGFGSDFVMVASEQAGFGKYVDNYICLNDHDIVVLEKKNGKIELTKGTEYTIRSVTEIDVKLSPDPYPHWTIREINEQVESCLRAMGNGARIIEDRLVKLGGLESREKELKELNHIIMLGCGTSYFAGMHTINTFKELSGFDTVQIFDGAEFTKYDIPTTGKTGLIFMSQSGETRDLARCIEIGKDKGLYRLGVVNVVDSLIAREVHCGVYLNAGREVGVASTKTFTSQVIVLNLIAVWFAQIRDLNEPKRREIIKDMRRLSIDIKNTIKETSEPSKKVAAYLANQNSLFILGKGNAESIAKEGALKIKEIGYIHAEGYSSSALKHGPYSLITPKTPIILIMPDNEHYVRNMGIIDEVKSREAFVVSITDKKQTTNKTKSDVTIMIPHNKSFSGLLSVIPFQLIGYELAIFKKHDPDFLRNLAKTITVD